VNRSTTWNFLIDLELGLKVGLHRSALLLRCLHKSIRRCTSHRLHWLYAVQRVALGRCNGLWRSPGHHKIHASLFRMTASQGPNDWCPYTFHSDKIDAALRQNAPLTVVSLDPASIYGLPEVTIKYARMPSLRCPHSSNRSSAAHNRSSNRKLPIRQRPPLEQHLCWFTHRPRS
jgi:hypothetical protein